MRQYLSSIFGITFVLTFLFVPFSVLATSPILDKAKSNATEVSEKIDFEVAKASDLEKVIQNGITTTLSVLGVIAVLLVVYAGGLWLTAAGSEEKIKSAKQIIRSVIIGVLIAGFAYAIVTFVISLILSS